MRCGYRRAAVVEVIGEPVRGISLHSPGCGRMRKQFPIKDCEVVRTILRFLFCRPVVIATPPNSLCFFV
jgi:hypothetical protein